MVPKSCTPCQVKAKLCTVAIRLILYLQFGTTALLQVWCDEQKKSYDEPHYLSIWEPVPPAGYEAAGLLASLGPQPPPLFAVRCVR